MQIDSNASMGTSTYLKGSCRLTLAAMRTPVDSDNLGRALSQNNRTRARRDKMAAPVDGPGQPRPPAAVHALRAAADEGLAAEYGASQPSSGRNFEVGTSTQIVFVLLNLF